MKNIFKPAWWLPGPHLQTLVASFMPRNRNLDTRFERLELNDGDFLDLAWIGQGSGPRVLILHGLNGSVNSHYVKGILATIEKRGWRGVLMHFRGCSTENNRLAQSYHAGETGDLQTVISTLMLREENSPLYAVGYSLGANVLLKYLGERDKNGLENPLKAAVAVSTPFKLAQTAKHLSSGFRRIYQWHLVRGLCAAYRRKFTHMPTPPEIDVLKVKRLKTFWDFDNAITAPLHGFKSADDYYAKSSSAQYLSTIKTPTLIVHARNDPFTTLECLPKESEISTAICLDMPEKGGHVGFISGKYPWQPIFWLENRIMNYLEENELKNK